MVGVIGLGDNEVLKVERGGLAKYFVPASSERLYDGDKGKTTKALEKAAKGLLSRVGDFSDAFLERRGIKDPAQYREDSKPLNAVLAHAFVAGILRMQDEGVEGFLNEQRGIVRGSTLEILTKDEADERELLESVSSFKIGSDCRKIWNSFGKVADNALEYHKNALLNDPLRYGFAAVPVDEADVQRSASVVTLDAVLQRAGLERVNDEPDYRASKGGKDNQEILKPVDDKNTLEVFGAFTGQVSLVTLDSGRTVRVVEPQFDNEFSDFFRRAYREEVLEPIVDLLGRERWSKPHSIMLEALAYARVVLSRITDGVEQRAGELLDSKYKGGLGEQVKKRKEVRTFFRDRHADPGQLAAGTVKPTANIEAMLEGATLASTKEGLRKVPCGETVAQLVEAEIKLLSAKTGDTKALPQSI